MDTPQHPHVPGRPAAAPVRTTAATPARTGPTGARWRPRPGRTGRAAGGGGSARNQAVGAYGERRAAAALEDAGLVVVDRNWRCELGEIDLVAVRPGRGPGDPLTRARELVVVEVKTRTSTRFGTPAGQVTAAKAARLRALAARWVQEHPAARSVPVRVDVVGVLLVPGAAPVVQHLQGVA